jgi:hypothetical protein
MSEVEELNFILDVLIDLKTNYKTHNGATLQDLIDIVKYRIEITEKQIH